MKTVVIVPYRPDHGHRDNLWKFVRDNYWRHQDHELIVGEHLTGNFNRSQAINDAAQHTTWDYAVIADADTWVPENQLYQALLTARRSKRLTAAFDAVVELSPHCTDDLLAQRTPITGSFTAGMVRTRDLETQSSMLVICRDLWDRIGGYDEAFNGWGGEDNAFWLAATLAAGEPHRITGNAYHLWHPPAAGKHTGRQYRTNLRRWQQYQTCTDLTQLQQLREG